MKENSSQGGFIIGPEAITLLSLTGLSRLSAGLVG